MRITFLFVVICLAAPLASGQESATEAPKLKTLNDHFPFVVESAEAWQTRSEALRRRVLVATGLWPMPEKPAIKPVIHGKVERDGFTIEKVYFESLPGHFVTGLLFRPSDDNARGIVDGRRPGVLSPHGHGGRLMRLDDERLKKELESGGEVFENSGRYPKLARCAHLARMGCVAFIFDMLGYADSNQISHPIAHRHAEARPEESDRSQPCFYSIEADLNLQSIMGLQTWNAIRSLDFLAELNDVDENRLGVTGGSGGGTQTILLGAIDPRIKVGFPNGMVSTGMQGGCYCENCNYLRIGTGNVELAALFAPKPMGMTAADDWTREMLTDGFPQLQQLYEMTGDKADVMCADLLRFPHNYNYVTRSKMYPWMAKHLGLPSDTPLVEEDYEPLSDDEMRVWNDDHPAPEASGVEHERDVLRWWKDQSDALIGKTIPWRAEDLERYREVIGGAWQVIFDRELPDAEQVSVESLPAVDTRIGKPYRLTHAGWGTSVDATVIEPLSGNVKRVIIYAARKSGSTADETLRYAAAGLSGDLDSLIVIPRLINEAQPSSDAEKELQPLVEDKRSYSGFTFTYNRPLVVKRFEQVMCAIAAFTDKPDLPVHLVSEGRSISASGAAAAIKAKDKVTQLICVSDGFRFSDVDEYDDADFLPGAVKYFDLPGLLSMRAPLPLTVIGDDPEELALLKGVYSAADGEKNLTIIENPGLLPGQLLK